MTLRVGELVTAVVKTAVEADSGSRPQPPDTRTTSNKKTSCWQIEARLLRLPGKLRPARRNLPDGRLLKCFLDACKILRQTRSVEFVRHRFFVWRKAAGCFLFGALVNTLGAAPFVLGHTNLPLPFDGGQHLFNELNCRACHSDVSDSEHGPPRQSAPLLGINGITPQFLRQWLTNPQETKPGATMPDLLHHLDPATKSNQVDLLVHYLLSLQGTNVSGPVAADQFKMEQGRNLYHQVGCVACHAPQEAASGVLPVKMAEPPPAQDWDASQKYLETNSVPLGPLAKKYSVAELTAFLMNPLRSRPGGRMPSLLLGQSEAVAVAMYLLRDQAPSVLQPETATERLRGLRYHYYEGGLSESPDLDKLTVHSSGTIERFLLTPRRRGSEVAFRFTGMITIPVPGLYQFFTESDDGSRLYLHHKVVVDNWGTHASQEKRGEIELTAGEHPIMVTYFNGGGESRLKVSLAGPGMPKQEIPAALLSHVGQSMQPLQPEKIAVDPVKAERGLALFGSLGCASCHQTVRSDKSLASAKAAASLNAQSSTGCLAPRPAKGVPQFAFSDEQRALLQKFIGQREATSRQVDREKARLLETLAALNCLACHVRDEAGGAAEGRSDYFFTLSELEMGEEGRLPPQLTGVGQKLKTEAIREILSGKGSVRPYLATRMPFFGDGPVQHLPALFTALDRKKGDQPAPPYTLAEAKFGRKLVGAGGLACISCHTFGRLKSLGIPAVDLTQVARRLNREWFHPYLIDPQALRPGTRMPTFWPDGKAANQEILEGDTDRQINAIWMYLSKGGEAEPPAGMVQGKMELVATNEPIIYRELIDGAGTRSIAVGYPEKANLAFDANEGRLAWIWQGSFVDASGHRSGRGGAKVRPLGDHAIQFPNGPAFAALADEKSPWPTASSRWGTPGFKMKGYQLDEKGRPRFLYASQGFEVEDDFQPVATQLDPKLVRTLKIKENGAPAGSYYRSMAATKLARQEDGSYLVDEKLSLRLGLPPGVQPVLRESGGKMELLVPLSGRGPELTIVEEMTW